MATKPSWLSRATKPSGPRYESLSLDPMHDTDPASDASLEDTIGLGTHGHHYIGDPQQPKRWTALNRPSRTRSWLIVLCFVLLIAVGMGIWSDWQPLERFYKKLGGVGPADGDAELDLGGEAEGAMGGGVGGTGDGFGDGSAGIAGDVAGGGGAAVGPEVTPRAVVEGGDWN